MACQKRSAIGLLARLACPMKPCAAFTSRIYFGVWWVGFSFVDMWSRKGDIISRIVATAVFLILRLTSVFCFTHTRAKPQHNQNSTSRTHFEEQHTRPEDFPSHWRQLKSDGPGKIQKQLTNCTRLRANASHHRRGRKEDLRFLVAPWILQASLVEWLATQVIWIFLGVFAQGVDSF